MLFSITMRLTVSSLRTDNRPVLTKTMDSVHCLYFNGLSATTHWIPPWVHEVYAGRFCEIQCDTARLE